MLPPKVSVVMPVFNAAPYLRQAMDSVLNQTFADFEFVIHDDGSTDESWTILTDYAACDGRVLLTRSENRGIPVTLDALMERAQGALIARMDADDICPPDRFARQVAEMDADPTLSVIGGAALIIDADGRPISVNALPQTHEEIDALNMSGRVAIQQSAVMIRRADYDRAGGYDRRFPVAEDHDLWLRLAEIGTLRNLPDVMIEYRVHDKSISGTKTRLQREMCLQACQDAWARRGTTAPFEYNEWRMEDTKASRLEYFLRYSWQAWAHGFRPTSRHYALRALRLAPTSAAAWKALVFGTLRRSPGRA